ncbi:MAG: hypothetical protein KDD70_18095, partial [Bdellovibrionales bacterium]|nr:hypothetical protein [Bdellovibrionales bacterium]
IVSRDLVSREAVSREHGTKEDSVIESDVVASGKIVSFVPRKSPQFSAQDSSNVPSRGQIPIAHEVQNVDIPDGPYYL